MGHKDFGELFNIFSNIEDTQYLNRLTFKYALGDK